MSTGSSDAVQKYRDLTDWLAVYWERLALTLVGWVLAVGVIASMAYRLAWRQGWTEPATREGYAVVQTLANLGSLFFLAALFTIAYAAYRRWRGSVECV